MMYHTVCSLSDTGDGLEDERCLSHCFINAAEQWSASVLPRVT